jgi:hypothetical protein
MLDWGKTVNSTYDFTPSATWTTIESEVGMICANMPGIAALIRHVAPRFLSGASCPDGGKWDGYSAAPADGNTPLPLSRAASSMSGLRPIHLIQMHHGRDREGMLRVADGDADLYSDADDPMCMPFRPQRTAPKGQTYILRDSKTGMARLA